MGSRIIRDIFIKNSPLLFNPALPANFRIDLSYAQLRATSPIHLEYLHNMGVRATYTLAIINGNKLWGLFAHHHYSPILMSYLDRKTYEFISYLFLENVFRINKKKKELEIKHQREKIQKVVSSMFKMKSLELFDCIVEYDKLLMEIFSASGIAILEEQKLFTSGKTPNEPDLRRIQQYLQERVTSNIFSNRSVGDLLKDSENPSEHKGGLLSICIKGSAYLFIIWFRPPVTEIVHWGGNPEEAVIIEKREDSKKVRLSPRKSFRKWREEIQGLSLPWESYEIENAEWLHARITQIDLFKAKINIEDLNHRVSVILNDEIEQLIYIASHDLQEPLRTITNYVDLILKEKSVEKDGIALKDEEFNFYLDRIALSATRMKNMIRSLLDYSRMGRLNELEEVDLNEVLNNIMNDLASIRDEKKANIQIDRLPVIIGDQTELRQLFQNLLVNALKYSRPDVPVNIVINSTFQDGSWHFTVSDNGIGISERDQEKVFMLFQRLHKKSKYEGTGIGLAIVKKIVESYHGNIQLKSVPGKGSDFYFTLKNKIPLIL